MNKTKVTVMFALLLFGTVPGLVARLLGVELWSFFHTALMSMQVVCGAHGLWMFRCFCFTAEEFDR